MREKRPWFRPAAKSPGFVGLHRRCTLGIACFGLRAMRLFARARTDDPLLTHALEESQYPSLRRPSTGFSHPCGWIVPGPSIAARANDPSHEVSCLPFRRLMKGRQETPKAWLEGGDQQRAQRLHVAGRRVVLRHATCSAESMRGVPTKWVRRQPVVLGGWAVAYCIFTRARGHRRRSGYEKPESDTP